MLPSRARSRSWGAGPWPPSPRLEPRHQRSSSTTYSPPLISESDGGGMGEPADEVAQQEQTELMQSNGGETADDERVRLLQREVAVAKQTETKMLESLIHQTKQLEQTKIALEEAKLEIATLRHQRQQQPGAEAQAPQWSVMDLMFGGVDDEINGLRARLRAAALAEERSRKAADDLAAALSAVTMEAKQVKAWLSDAQAELERANAEVDRLGGLLRAAEGDLWSTTERVDALTSEWKESGAAWRAREKALAGRARAAEEELGVARRENTELAEARRALDDENGGLRLALERAVEVANGTSESLELASGDNARLQDAVAESQRAVDTLRRENEALKVSDAAARERAKDLENQLALSAVVTKKTADDAIAGKTTSELPLEKWRGEMQGKLSAAFLDSGARVMAGRKDRPMFASLSNIAELKSAAAAAAMDDFDYEFDHQDGVGQYGVSDHAMKHKKRRSIMRKFGDLFRRRSLYKSNLAPVLHHY